MRIFPVLLFLVGCLCSQAQPGRTADTLVVGPKKIALTPSTDYYPPQPGQVFVVSEYRCAKSRQLTVKYQKRVDTIVSLYWDEESNMLQAVDDNKDVAAGEFMLVYFCDTIQMTWDEFCNLKPFITYPGGKAYFYASKVSFIQNGMMGEVNHKFMMDNDVFAMWHPCKDLTPAETEHVRDYTFLVQYLYYKKRPSLTYYLPCDFIIRIKK